MVNSLAYIWGRFIWYHGKFTSASLPDCNARGVTINNSPKISYKRTPCLTINDNHQPSSWRCERNNLSLIDTHVIDLHALRPDGLVYALSTSPITANRYVHNEMKPLIKRPSLEILFGRPCYRVVFFIVNIKINLVGHPFDDI